MPVGVIVDAVAVIIGGIAGAVAGKALKKDFIDNMNLILGCCSICMGISTIVLMQHMPADHSVLIAKAILDLFTAVVFACTLGMVTAAVAIPQFIIFFILFLLGAPIYNGLDLGTNTYIINDFKACGGFIMLATGFRMCKIKMFPVADMIPAMVLIFPIAIFWNNYVTPAVNMLAGMVH